MTQIPPGSPLAKRLASHLRRAVTQPDTALLIELASGALLLAWLAHVTMD